MRRWKIWSVTGFGVTAVLGTVFHFVYEWSEDSVWAGAFCAVNESTWEHMKLLFFPVLLCTVFQVAVSRDRDGGLPAARAVSVTAGLALIPLLYYTYTGVLGFRMLWADLTIFYLSDAAVFRLDARLRRRGRLWGVGAQLAGLLWLWLLAFLFVWWTFQPPHIGLFLDPVTGQYGI